jgi:hypothetical protein
LHAELLRCRDLLRFAADRVCLPLHERAGHAGREQNLPHVLRTTDPDVNKNEVNNLILDALEHERGGVTVYETAIDCVANDDLRKEWNKYLAETESHVAALTDVCRELGIDPEQATPTRDIVKALGASLVKAMQTAKRGGNADAAQLVACDCVVLAEVKDHANWDLLSHVAEHMTGPAGKLLREACDTIHEQEGEHLFHSKGWCRELAIKALGMKAVLPPPEERKHVKTAIGAARAEQQRESSD